MNVDYFASMYNLRPTLDKRAETQNATVQEDHVVLATTGRYRALIAALLFLKFPLSFPRHLSPHAASQLCQKLSQGLLRHKAWWEILIENEGRLGKL